MSNIKACDVLKALASLSKFDFEIRFAVSVPQNENENAHSKTHE